jgi:TonB family protein
MIGFAALLLAVANPPGVEKGATGAGDIALVPLSAPVSWISTDDDPADALRMNEQGKVRISLAIGADGVPSACHVDESSGSAALDERSCAILMERARFQPPRDARGQPVEATYTRSIRWQIPSYPDAVPVWVTIKADGARFSCSAEVKGVVRHLTDRVCQALGESVSKSGRPLDRPVLAQLPDDPDFLEPAGREK